MGAMESDVAAIHVFGPERFFVSIKKKAGASAPEDSPVRHIVRIVVGVYIFVSSCAIVTAPKIYTYLPAFIRMTCGLQFFANNSKQLYVRSTYCIPGIIIVEII